MKLKLLIFFLSILIYSNTFANTYIEKEILGHKIKFIKYDVSGNEYNLKFVKSDNGSSLKDLTIKNNGITGVNGVFFCPADYNDCKGKENTTNNERYFDGVKYNYWPTTGDRVVFGLDNQNLPILFQTDKINPDSEGEIKDGFSNWPLLLKDGKNQLEYYWDRNMIDAKMRASSTRNIICNDKDKKNIYFGFVYDAYMDDLPIILSEFGCSDALNLDAGKSSAFVYNGKYLVGPGRNIIDGIVIERKGLDVKKLIEKAKKVSKIINNKIEKEKTIKEKINSLQEIIKDLSKIKTTIYEKNSKDIIENKEGEEKINGYEIEVNDIPTLSKIYSINYILGDLNKYVYTLKKDEKNNSLTANK